MKFFFKKNCLILLWMMILSLNTKVYCKNFNIKYPKEDISNYFIGIVSAKQDYTSSAFKHLNKIQYLQDNHINFKIEFIRTLILLEKFDEAFDFSKKSWTEDELFFESDLLLGINSFISEDYENAKKYFKRLNNFSRHNLPFSQFINNILLSWVEAAQNNKQNSSIGN